MSQNDHTGLENLSERELVSECFRSHDPIVHRPLEMELAKRVETLADQVERLEKFDTLDLSFDKMGLLKDHLVNSTEETVGLLKILAEFELDGDDADYLRAALQAAKIINEAA